MSWPLFLCSGPAKNILTLLQKSKKLRYARVHTVARGRNVQRIVLGIGQIHPVLSGTFSWWTARKIANVQAWIYVLCRYLYEEHDVWSFGQEGFSSQSSGKIRARFGSQLLNTLEARLKGDEGPKAAKKLLQHIASDWRNALKFGNMPEASKQSTALNAVTILQALEDDVSVFPIEQKRVHGKISQGLNQLRIALQKVENSAAYRSAASKQGKGLSQAEYDAMQSRNRLVQQFNKMIAHPERDKSILREVVEHAENEEITVFILGEGHRRGFLRMAKRHIPDDMLFVWITPPGLWWWKAMFWRCVYCTGAVCVGGLIIWML